LIAAVKLALHLVAIGQYGYFRDELYYLASTEHLHWGYVDHPPLSIAILSVVRGLLGDSLFALRIFPTLCGVATVGLAGAIARRLGGGRFAQGLAALSVCMAPVFLGTARFYSMNAIEQLIWALAALLLLQAVDEGRRPHHWVLLGVVMGLGLLNKISALWLGGGIALGLLLTSHRRHLVTPWPWLAGGVAALLFLPHVVWQVQNGWPTLEFMRNATSTKMLDVAPLQYMSEQILSMNPATAPIWIAGIIFAFTRAGQHGRILAWLYLAVLVLLVVNGRSRVSYLSPAYPPLLALGSVAIERFTAVGRRWLRPALAALVTVVGLGLAPLAMPLLPVETYVRYQAALGREPHTEENHEMGALPQHFADMHGWENMVDLVAQAYERLTPEERARCRVFGQNYGEAGAVDVLGRRLGVPPALSGHNSYWLWGPGDATFDVLIIIGGDREDNAEFFEEIEIVGQTQSDWSMPYERGLDVSIGRKPRMSITAAWPQLKHYN
jgi:hypothetical protein